jgi:hypothetical protein
MGRHGRIVLSTLKLLSKLRGRFCRQRQSICMQNCPKFEVSTNLLMSPIYPVFGKMLASQAKNIGWVKKLQKLENSNFLLVFKLSRSKFGLILK